MAYSLVSIDPSEYHKWDQFVDSSNEGTIFHKANFLSALRIDYKIFYLMKGNNPVAGITISLDTQNKKLATLPDNLIYNGLIFQNGNNMSINSAKKYSKEFAIMSFIVEELTKRYDLITIQMSPIIKDIRPFLWFNYDSEKINEKLLDS